MMRAILGNITRLPLSSAFLVLLIPGIHLKRWLALGFFGTIAVILGVLFAFEISLAPGFHSIVGTLSLKFAPTSIRSGVFIGLGAIFAGSALVKLLMGLMEFNLTAVQLVALLFEGGFMLLETMFLGRQLPIAAFEPFLRGRTQGGLITVQLARERVERGIGGLKQLLIRI